jgi:hypothetical protein
MLRRFTYPPCTWLLVLLLVLPSIIRARGAATEQLSLEINVPFPMNKTYNAMRRPQVVFVLQDLIDAVDNVDYFQWEMRQPASTTMSPGLNPMTSWAMRMTMMVVSAYFGGGGDLSGDLGCFAGDVLGDVLTVKTENYVCEAAFKSLRGTDALLWYCS